MARGSFAPLLLLVYFVAFAWKALSGGLLVFDDHPGQLYRLSHAIGVGLAPWRLNPGWWAGYAELQFYPPGFSYAGAVLYHASFGMLGVAAVYRVLLWVTFLLPGITTYALLGSLLQDPWLALPGAFLAFTLSVDSRSGVEQGMRWGLVAARLGWSLLPLLALSLHRATRRAVFPILPPILLAVIILIHPAHAPAGIVLVVLAMWRVPSLRVAQGTRAALVLAATAGLSAFWLVPLVAHLSMTLPLAWGDPTLSRLARSVGEQPLLLGLVVASVLSWWAERWSPSSAASRWIKNWAPAMAVVIMLDTIIAQPLGMLWLPADRIVDSFLLSLVVGASFGLPMLRQRLRIPTMALAALSIAVSVSLSVASPAGPALSLWPGSSPNEWPKYEAVALRVGFPQLWQALRDAPPGRILFVESGVALDHGTDWRRPHSHIASLVPLNGGRQILNGTFTHPSPIAGFLYTGSAVNRPLTALVEQRDGLALFGRPFSELDAATFDALAERLRVSAVIAVDEDRGRMDFVERNPAFTGPLRVGSFLVFTSREPRPLPEADGAQRWRVVLSAQPDGWTSTGMAYSPLWRCVSRGQLLLARKSDVGLLEVRIPPGESVNVELEHRAGAAELIGLGLAGASLMALGLVCYHRLRDLRARPGSCG